MSFNWDVDNDGRTSYADLMSNFDKNHDNKLDGDEIMVLAEQLSSQLEYNNTLLQQVQQLEHEQVEAHKELRSKVDTIRMLNQESERMKFEIGDLKKKLSVAHEMTESLARQSREYRGESNAYKQEAENALRESANNKVIVDKLSADKVQLQKALSESAQANQLITHDLNSKLSDSNAQLEMLKKVNDSLNSEINDCRNRITSTESEKQNLQNTVKQLGSSIEDLSNRLQTESKLREREEAINRDLSSELDKTRSELIKANVLLHDTMDKTVDLQQQNDALKNEMTRSQEDLSNALMKANHLENQTQNALESQQITSAALDAAKKENASLQAQMQHMQDKFSKLLSSTREEYENALTETRRQSLASISDSQRRAAFAEEAQQKAEESYFNIHHELNELHEIMQQLQQAHDKDHGEWAQEKQHLEQRLKGLQEQLQHYEGLATNHEKALKSCQEECQKTVMDVKQESSRRMDHAIEVLQEIQRQNQTLKKESQKLKEYMIETTQGLEGWRQGWTNVNQQLRAELVRCQEEMKVLIKKFSHMKDGYQHQLEDVEDQKKEAEIRIEEEKSKILDREDYISQLQLKVSSLENTLAHNEYVVADQTRKCQSILEKSSSDKSLADGKMQKLQQALDAMSLQNKNLQSGQLELKNALSETTKQAQQERSELENRVSGLINQLKATTEERSQLNKTNEDLKKKIDEFTQLVASTKEEGRRFREECVKLKQEMDELKQKHLQTISNVGGANQQYHNQLKQSQELLKVSL